MSVLSDKSSLNVLTCCSKKHEIRWKITVEVSKCWVRKPEGYIMVAVQFVLYIVHSFSWETMVTFCVRPVCVYIDLLLLWLRFWGVLFLWFGLLPKLLGNVQENNMDFCQNEPFNKVRQQTFPNCKLLLNRSQRCTCSHMTSKRNLLSKQLLL